MTLQIKAASKMLWRVPKKLNNESPHDDNYYDDDSVSYFNRLQRKFPQLDSQQPYVWTFPVTTYLSYITSHTVFYYTNEDTGQLHSAAELIAEVQEWINDVRVDGGEQVITSTDQLVLHGVDIDVSDDENIVAHTDISIRCCMHTLASLCTALDSSESQINVSDISVLM